MTTNTDRVRQVTLLAGEKILALLNPKDGLLPKAPEVGGLLTLTSRRLITFSELDGRKETRTIPLEGVEDVCVRSSSRNPKPLYQGLTLMFVGLLVYLVMGTFSDDGRIVAALLGLAIGLLGLLFIGRYLAWEQGGELIVSLGGREVSFPLESERAMEQSYEVLNGIMRAKAGESMVEALEIPEVNVGLFSSTPVRKDDFHPSSTQRDSSATEDTISPAPSTQSTERGQRPGPERPVDPDSVESSRTPQP